MSPATQAGGVVPADLGRKGGQDFCTLLEHSTPPPPRQASLCTLPLPNTSP